MTTNIAENLSFVTIVNVPIIYRLNKALKYLKTIIFHDIEKNCFPISSSRVETHWANLNPSVNRWSKPTFEPVCIHTTWSGSRTDTNGSFRSQRCQSEWRKTFRQKDFRP